MPQISVIMTAYQAERTIGKAIRSILNTPRKNEIEIVVMDDCSTDGTCDVIRQMQKDHPNIRLFSMEKNTGGPSAPRNRGMREATGEYITFLDDDDEIVPDNLLDMVAEIREKGADFGKGYLISVDGDRRNVYNRVADRSEDKKTVIRNIVAIQSMNSDFIVKRDLILEHDLGYRTDLRIGEDTVFVTGLMQKAEKPLYIDNYFLIHYNNPADVTNLSATQNVSDREINHQIMSWRAAEENLKGVGISYYKLRLPAAFRNLLLSIVRYSRGISEEAYQTLHRFALETRADIKGAMALSNRYEELYQAILSGDYQEYQDKSRRRLLINGYDLKFILPLVKYFEREFNVKVDEWTGHNIHNEAESKKLADWADIFWCEWLLGNAVYFSKLKNKNQRLVIRAHKFEMFREFGHQIDWNKVDMVFSVGYFTYEKFIEAFDIPREKMRLLSNFVENDIYSTEKTEDAKYHIGLVGALPKMKGLMRALELLKKLRETDDRFKLYVMGKRIDELPWLKNNPVEKEYYDSCDRFAKENGLSDAVIYGGFVEREKLYNDIGYVLSLSDNEKPESFHLAPAEGACAGSRGLVLRWAGVEYIYPEDVVFESIDEMAAEILKSAADDDYRQERAAAFRDYVLENYAVEKIFSDILNYMVHVRIGG